MVQSLNYRAAPALKMNGVPLAPSPPLNQAKMPLSDLEIEDRLSHWKVHGNGANDHSFCQRCHRTDPLLISPRIAQVYSMLPKLSSPGFPYWSVRSSSPFSVNRLVFNDQTWNSTRALKNNGNECAQCHLLGEPLSTYGEMINDAIAKTKRPTTSAAYSNSYPNNVWMPSYNPAKLTKKYATRQAWDAKFKTSIDALLPAQNPIFETIAPAEVCCKRRDDALVFDVSAIDNAHTRALAKLMIEQGQAVRIPPSDCLASDGKAVDDVTCDQAGGLQLPGGPRPMVCCHVEHDIFDRAQGAWVRMNAEECDQFGSADSDSKCVVAPRVADTMVDDGICCVAPASTGMTCTLMPINYCHMLPNNIAMEASYCADSPGICAGMDADFQALRQRVLAMPLLPQAGSSTSAVVSDGEAH